jgi:uncharacterized protein with von Willebrand factor type A (vWA) domain
MENKTQRNLAPVQKAILNLINTYTVPQGGNVPVVKPNNGGNVPKPKPRNNVLALPAPNNKAIVPVGNVKNAGVGPVNPLANRSPKETLTSNQVTRLQGIKTNAKNYNNAQFKNANSFVVRVSKNYASHPNVVAARNALAARKITQAAIGVLKSKNAQAGWKRAGGAIRAAQLLQEGGSTRAKSLLATAAKTPYNAFLENIQKASVSDTPTNSLYNIHGRIGKSGEITNTQKTNLKQKISYARLQLLERNIALATKYDGIKRILQQLERNSTKTAKILTPKHRMNAQAKAIAKRNSLNPRG